MDPVRDTAISFEAHLVVFLLCINDELGYFNEDIPRTLAGSLAHGKRKRKRPTFAWIDTFLTNLAPPCSIGVLSASTPPLWLPFITRQVSQLFRGDAVRRFHRDMWLLHGEFLSLPCGFCPTFFFACGGIGMDTDREGVEMRELLGWSYRKQEIKILIEIQ